MNKFCATFGVIGAYLLNILGGWDYILETLITFIAIDLVSGFALSSIFHNSSKTENGLLSSNEMFRGLGKKVMIMLYVIIAHRLDYLLGLDYCRNLIAISFITSELLSICENASGMGIPLPSVVAKCLEILKEKEKKE